MWLTVLLILAVVVTVVLAVRLLLVTAELRAVTKQLQERNAGHTQKKLTTTFSDRQLQQLCTALNRSLTKQEERARAVKRHEKALKQAIADLSHDLRTPLTSILGYLTLLRKSDDKAQADQYLTVIEGRAKMLSGLVADFFELSVIDHEDYTLPLEAVDLVALLTEVLLGQAEQLEAKGIHPTIVLPEKAVMVVGNAAAYRRVFENLLSNAVKHSDGDLAVSLVTQGDGCVITVENPIDSTLALDPDHLFDRFYTADASRNNKSTGLGLSIVKTLCEKMESTVSATLSADGTLSITVAVHHLLP